MSDQAVVHIGENSPEQVAFNLMRIIASSEGLVLSPTMGGSKLPDRDWVLDTYADCLLTVRDPFRRVDKRTHR